MTALFVLYVACEICRDSAAYGGDNGVGRRL
jgi:hypothetical protein